MPGSALVRRLLGAFRRGSPPRAPAVDDVHDAAVPADAPVTMQRQVPLHPLVTAGGGGATAPIVLAPLVMAASIPEAAVDDDVGDVPLPPTPAVVEFINETRQLPIFSTTAIQLMQSVGHENVSPERIARMISADAASSRNCCASSTRRTTGCRSAARR